MSAADDTDTTKKSAADSAALPKFPGEDNILAHDGSHWKELAEARLTACKLLSVAEGYEPHSVKAIAHSHTQ